MDPQLKETIKKSFTCSLFIGIFTLQEKSYILCAKEVSHVCIIERNEVFQINTIFFLPFEVKRVFPQIKFPSQKKKHLNQAKMGTKKKF